MKFDIIRTVKLGEKLTYIDFKIEGINGLFRAAKSSGVNFGHVLSQVFLNLEFFKYVVTDGVSKIFEEAITTSNYGNGWEWQETRHSQLHPEFLLGGCTSWYTCPFGGNLPEVQSMGNLYTIESDGIKLLHSWSKNKPPMVVCYFFPTKV